RRLVFLELVGLERAAVRGELRCAVGRAGLRDALFADSLLEDLLREVERAALVEACLGRVYRVVERCHRPLFAGFLALPVAAGVGWIEREAASIAGHDLG